jgi:hypothetical protein
VFEAVRCVVSTQLSTYIVDYSISEVQIRTQYATPILYIYLIINFGRIWILNPSAYFSPLNYLRIRPRFPRRLCPIPAPVQVVPPHRLGVLLCRHPDPEIYAPTGGSRARTASRAAEKPPRPSRRLLNEVRRRIPIAAPSAATQHPRSVLPGPPGLAAPSAAAQRPRPTCPVSVPSRTPSSHLPPPASLTPPRSPPRRRPPRRRTRSASRAWNHPSILLITRCFGCTGSHTRGWKAPRSSESGIRQRSQLMARRTLI